jgi:hypothetical protein
LKPPTYESIACNYPAETLSSTRPVVAAAGTPHLPADLSSACSRRIGYLRDSRSVAEAGIPLPFVAPCFAHNHRSAGFRSNHSVMAEIGIVHPLGYLHMTLHCDRHYVVVEPGIPHHCFRYVLAVPDTLHPSEFPQPVHRRSHFHSRYHLER